MAKASSQKFIARNRAPRVQIEYDVELYGAEKASFPDLLAPPTGEHLTGFVLDSIVYFVDMLTMGAPPLATAADGIELFVALAPHRVTDELLGQHLRDGEP